MSTRTPMTAALTDEHRVLIGRIMAVFAIASSVAALVIFLVLDPARMYRDFALHAILGAIVFAILGWLMVGPQPRNRAAWLFPWLAVSQGLAALGNALRVEATHRLGLPPEPVGLPVSDLGLTGSLGASLEYSIWVPGVVAMVTLALLWFPDGQVPSRRWRPVTWLAVAATAWLTLVLGWRSRPFGGVIPDPAADLGVTADVGYMAVGVSIALSLVALVVRYRRSRGTARRQFRWIAWATGSTAVLWLAANLADLLATGHIGGAIFNAVSLLSLPVFFGGYGIAIWRHQLFDIDLVINRTLVYASTLAVIAGIYVAVVFGVGSLLDRTGDGSPVLPVVATALVAIMFHPARVRLERLANRIVFGRRATPYEVLSDFTQRVAATDERLLADVARSVVDGTVATAASVWVLDTGMLMPVSVWPEERTMAPTAALRSAGSAGDELIVPGADETHPIRHDDEVIGALGLRLPVTEALPPGDRALIDELTAGISLALWNRELTSELQGAVDDLRTSRRRLVSVQDETRRRLERDLHDGAQQRLVAIKVRLSIVRQMVDKAGATDRATALAELCDDADDAIESLRDVARGIYPPLLEAEGLRAALDAQVGRSTLPIDLSGNIHARHRRDIEATTYFTILEALAAIERSPHTDLVQVTVTEHADNLTFEVLGPTDSEPPQHVEDRIEALGGQIRFGDGGAVVSGWLPTTARRETVGV